MRKKTIIFILPDLETGGAERIVTTLANHLPREKFIPKIMLLRKQGGYLALLKEDVEVIDLKIQRIRHGLFPILKQLRKLKPDLVFCGFGEINAYLSLFIKFFPKTIFIARETNVVSQHVRRPEIKFFYKFYNNFHKIICQSDDMLQDLLDNFKIKFHKLIKINNPVDFDFIQSQLTIPEKPQYFCDNYKHVVAIGNLSYRKGFDNLLKVFTLMKNKPIKLHILGDGKDKEKLIRMKQQQGLEHVIFHGRQSNPYHFLKHADLFVLSSRYEGFPNVLLEAGACGVYALANNCLGGIHEIIQTGINGEISCIDDYENFSKKIEVLLSQQHDKQKITESIKKRFSKDKILLEYENVLDTTYNKR